MSELCEVCFKAPWKYKCPRCFKKTCSLACYKKHKEMDNCSGLPMPTDYVSHEKLKKADTGDETNPLVQRDYNFLIGMNRKLTVMKEDGKSKNRRVLSKSNTTAGYGGYAVSKPARVIRRGVKCLLLPKGMQRSLSNKSKWDKPLDTFVWSLDWVLVDRNGAVWNHLSHRNKEESRLVDCVGKQVYDKCVELYRQDLPEEETGDVVSTKEDRSKRIVEFGLHYFVKWFPDNVNTVMDTKELVEIDPSKPIGEIFKEKTVIEFPTIFIVPSIQLLTKIGFCLHTDSPAVAPVSTTVVERLVPKPEDPQLMTDLETADSIAQLQEVARSDSDSDSETDSDSDSSAPEEDAINYSSDSDDGYTVGVSLDFLTA